MKALPRRLPVRVGHDAWGRLDELSAAGAVLTTQAVLRRGEVVVLSFELHGETFTELDAVVSHAAPDDDGFTRAEVDFRDQVHRRRLATALLDVLSRQ